MRKIMKGLIIAVIAVIGFVVTSCGDGNGSTTDPCKDGHDWNWIITTHPNFTTITEGEQTKTCNRCSETDGTQSYPILELGDTGPAGGKIIYIDPAGFEVTSTTAAFTTYTAYYLEAAPANAVGGTGAQTSMMWTTRLSEPYPNVTGTLFTIGSGRNNTALIIAAEKAAYPSDTYIYAALACDNYFVAGYETFNDWFLPSRNELNQLCLRQAYVGLSSSDRFWSSSQSQFNSSSAWHQNFASGWQDTHYKSFGYDVRPVRAF
ncbi:MAG: DUF1566 domain-containing protein [Treponema sp.]|nr:DUF1566 domain-containing protein [Treponema sp.]